MESQETTIEKTNRVLMHNENIFKIYKIYKINNHKD